jgi:uncharacterized membrane protein
MKILSAARDPAEECVFVAPRRRYRVALIYLTGVLEFALAALLLLPRFRRAAAWACIVVLILFFPANIYAALERVGMGGHLWGPVYLLIRAPLQLILIGWALIFGPLMTRLIIESFILRYQTYACLVEIREKLDGRL